MQGRCRVNLGAPLLAEGARYIAPDAGDPWVVLGVEPGADAESVRTAYRNLVKAYHPDRHMADGTPPEFIRVAEARMAAINAAYATIVKGRVE